MVFIFVVVTIVVVAVADIVVVFFQNLCKCRRQRQDHHGECYIAWINYARD